MSRAGRFRIAAMQALWSQLEFVPVPATRRMLARIREIMPGISADALYEPTEVVRSIVRFPVEQAPGGEGGMLVGAALRADLAELALRLSRRAPVPAGLGVMDLCEAASAARVCVRTLRRWRERGLLLQWIGAPPGPVRVGVLAEDLRAFTDAHPGLCAGAAGFRRIGARVREAIVREGLPRVRTGEPMARVTRDLAARHGCSSGAIRAMLLGAAAVDGPRPARARAQRLWEEWIAGTPVPALAARHGVSGRAAAHALRAERVRRIAAMRDRLRADAAGVAPDAPAAAEWRESSAALAVGAAADSGRSAAAPAAAPAAGTPGEPPRAAHAIAMRALLARAAACPDRPSASELDRAETDIRWAARLLLTLTRAATPALERRMRVWMAGLDRASADAAAGSMPSLAACAVLEACRTDVAALRRGRVRIERLASAELDLALARAGAQEPGGRAHSEARAPRDAARIDGWIAAAAPWAALAPLQDECARGLAAAASPRSAAPRTGQQMLAWRQGWDGAAPATLDEIASAADRPRWVVARAIGRARAALPVR